NRAVRPFEIDGYHRVEAFLCHLCEQPELAVPCIDEDAVQVPELLLDRGEHRVEVAEIADVCAHGETAGAQRRLRRLQRPLIQAADGDARALAVEFLRGGQPDPAVAAGDQDMLVRESTHGRPSLRLHMSVSATLRGNVAAAYQLRETRGAESLLNGVVRGVEDWAKPACHRASHHASLMHLGREDLQTGQRHVAMFA